jgi:hypothetical protein
LALISVFCESKCSIHVRLGFKRDSTNRDLNSWPLSVLILLGDLPSANMFFTAFIGQEFKSRLVESLLKPRRTCIEHLLSQNTEIKANYVERVIKTTKSKMYRYFTHAQSYKYIGELQKFAGSYNKTYHYNEK